MVMFSGNHGALDFWIVKLDEDGNLGWQKSLGGGSDDGAAFAQQTTDGGYIAAGYSNSNNGNVSGNHGGGDYWLVKLDANGGITWKKCFGGTVLDYGTSVQQISGGYIMAGYSSSVNGDVTGNHGSSDYWLVRVDNNGVLLWQKSLGGSGQETASCVQQTADGGYVVTGSANSTNGDVSGNHGLEDFWVVKLSTDVATGIASQSNEFVSVYPNPANYTTQSSIPAKARWRISRS
jgi:hypothetical protein